MIGLELNDERANSNFVRPANLAIALREDPLPPLDPLQLLPAIVPHLQMPIRWGFSIDFQVEFDENSQSMG